MVKRTKYIVIDKRGKIVSSANTKRIANLTPLQSGDKLYHIMNSHVPIKRKKK